MSQTLLTYKVSLISEGFFFFEFFRKSDRVLAVTAVCLWKASIYLFFVLSFWRNSAGRLLQASWGRNHRFSVNVVLPKSFCSFHVIPDTLCDVRNQTLCGSFAEMQPRTCLHSTSVLIIAPLFSPLVENRLLLQTNNSHFHSSVQSTCCYFSAPQRCFCASGFWQKHSYEKKPDFSRHCPQKYNLDLKPFVMFFSIWSVKVTEDLEFSFSKSKLLHHFSEINWKLLF